MTQEYPERLEYGSNVPLAREILRGISRDDVMPDAWEQIQEALTLMTRAKTVRKAPNKMRGRITELMKQRIHELAATTNLTCAEIALAVGLPPSASGRVSEVLHGLR